MDSSGKSGIIKFILVILFLGGAYILIRTAAYTDYFAAKAGFAALGIFSLLSALGIALMDMSSIVYMRSSTKFAGAMLPVSLFGGAGAEEFLLLKGYETAASICSGVCIIIFCLCTALLMRRYRNDNLY